MDMKIVFFRLNENGAVIINRIGSQQKWTPTETSYQWIVADATDTYVEPLKYPVPLKIRNNFLYRQDKTECIR